jgi:hypothetical protein
MSQAAPAAAAPECLILDDAELEQAGKPAGFRNWRVDASQLTASRIFGGGPSATPVTAPAAPAGFRSFPSAFQTYKPGTGLPGKEKRFPFFEQRSGGAPKSGTVDISGRPQLVLRQPSVPPPTIQIPPSPEEPRYSQCTPPCYSPKTPPYWDASGNYIVAGQVVDTLTSKQDGE